MQQVVKKNSEVPSPIVWTIAGSDSGGGAGIQADLLTLHDLGCHGCSVITANTAQNTRTVAAINPVSPEVLESQLQALMGDLFPAAIKIGLLANAEQVFVVARFLHNLKQQNQSVQVVYDPVAVATSGAPLTEDSTGDAVKKALLPLCDLITPNCHELEWLSLSSASDAAQTTVAAEKLLELRCGAVLVTGGHGALDTETVADFLLDLGGGNWLIGNKIATENTHGTGCTLSSAIAAGLALGYPLRDACVVGHAYVHRSLRRGKTSHIGAGPGPVAHCGWPDSLEDFPAILLPGSDRARKYSYFSESAAAVFAQGFPAPGTERLGVYPVVDSVEWLEKLAVLGVRTMQLRIKSPKQGLREQIIAAVAIGRQYEVRLFINDYWQLAIECDAYGVHLGQEDLETADLQAIRAAGLKLGISTHGFYELLRAYEYRPSYLAIGAIFATDTKDMSTQLQGTVKLSRMAKLFADFPLVAIGGITLARAEEVAATGVGSIAVVTAITKAKDYTLAVGELQSYFE